MKRWLAFALCVPVNLGGWLLLGLVLLWGAGTRVRAVEPDNRSRLMVRGLAGGFLERHWAYSTTLGPHALYLHPRATPDIVAHELVHTRQSEGVSIAWALASLLSWSSAMAVLWPAAWGIVYGGASLAAWLAGRPPYYGNEYEVQAYALQLRLHEQDVKAGRVIVTPPGGGA